VSLEIGLQVQDNDGVSQLLADAHDDEQHHGDLITNEQQDMSVREDINQVDGTNVRNQSVPKEIIELPMLISHQPITMQTSTPECNKPIVKSSMLMMTNQMQMMTSVLFAFKQYALMQIENILIQMDNANACMTIITIVLWQCIISMKGAE
jgi:hypothetical protein